jgi:nicotinamide riboside kinase
MVYARHYYGDCPAWVEQAARERRADLYLLCEIDVPWIADPYRDREHLRDHMQALFAAALESLGARYVPIRGSWDERFAAGVAAVTPVCHSERAGEESLNRSPSA